MGLDSCDDVISVLQRDLDSGSLTPTSLISTVNPSGNTINIDKVRAAVIGMNDWCFIASGRSRSRADRYASLEGRRGWWSGYMLKHGSRRSM